MNNLNHVEQLETRSLLAGITDGSEIELSQFGDNVNVAAEAALTFVDGSNLLTAIAEFSEIAFSNIQNNVNAAAEAAFAFVGGPDLLAGIAEASEIALSKFQNNVNVASEAALAFAGGALNGMMAPAILAGAFVGIAASEAADKLGISKQLGEDTEDLLLFAGSIVGTVAVQAKLINNAYKSPTGISALLMGAPGLLYGTISAANSIFV